MIARKQGCKKGQEDENVKVKKEQAKRKLKYNFKLYYKGTSIINDAVITILIMVEILIYIC